MLGSLVQGASFGAVIGIFAKLILDTIAKVITYLSSRHLINNEIKRISTHCDAVKRILSQALENIKQNSVIPLQCVHFRTSNYDKKIHLIEWSLSERKLYHMYYIYEWIRVLQVNMESYESNVNSDADKLGLEELRKKYHDKVSEYLEMVGIIKGLSDKYTNKEIIDVMNVPRVDM